MQSVMMDTRQEHRIGKASLWFAGSIALVIVASIFGAPWWIIAPLALYAGYHLINVAGLIVFSTRVKSLVEVVFSEGVPSALVRVGSGGNVQTLPISSISDAQVWTVNKLQTLVLFSSESKYGLFFPLTNHRGELMRTPSELEALAAVVDNCSIPDSRSAVLAPKGRAILTSLGKQEIIDMLDRLLDKVPLI
jgi:hypothetical protein